MSAGHHDNATHENYHGHPNYWVIWGVLMFLMFISLILGEFQSTQALIALYAIATLKAVIVIRNFMHVRWEPIDLALMLVASVFALACYFFGVWPDIIPIEQHIVK